MSKGNFNVRLPSDKGSLGQDEEYFLIQIDGNWKKIRFHDYNEIYKVPGLYEHLFYERLECDSPKVVAGLLEDEMSEISREMSDLNVLDLGAGNGIVGEVLAGKGVNLIVGVDIIEEAAHAVERDRPGVYDNYLVEDFRDINDSLEQELKENNFNCMTCVAALGFNDIPPDAFANGFNLLDDQSVVAFNIKPNFIEDSDSSGFSCLIREAAEKNIFKIKSAKSYCHRLSVNGDSIDYVAIVGTKIDEIPEDMCIDRLGTGS